MQCPLLTVTLAGLENCTHVPYEGIVTLQTVGECACLGIRGRGVELETQVRESFGSH